VEVQKVIARKSLFRVQKNVILGQVCQHKNNLKLNLNRHAQEYSKTARREDYIRTSLRLTCARAHETVFRLLKNSQGFLAYKIFIKIALGVQKSGSLLKISRSSKMSAHFEKLELAFR
jgi:hypothetical protein